MGKAVHGCVDSQGKHMGYTIHCPACKHAHLLDSRWTFNNNLDKPTFRPSLLCVGDEQMRKETEGRYGHRCHSFITDGNIQYLNDCTHEMKGKTVKLEEF